MDSFDREQAPRTPQVLPRHHCYGKKGAACFEVVLVENKYRITLDLAEIKRSETSHEVLWDTKINFLLMDHELPVLAAVLLGYAPKLKIVRGDKTVEMERQPPKNATGHGGLFVKGFSVGKLVTMPISPGDLFWVNALILNFLCNQSGCSPETVIASIRGIHRLIGMPKESNHG